MTALITLTMSLIVALFVALGKILWFVMKRTGTWLYFTLFPILFFGFFVVAVWIGIQPKSFSPFQFALFTSDAALENPYYAQVADWSFFWVFWITLVPVLMITARTIIRLVKKDPLWTYRRAYKETKQKKQMSASTTYSTDNTNSRMTDAEYRTCVDLLDKIKKIQGTGD